MELKKLTEHIWYMPYEEERDRPNLGYVKGDNWSLAIDAGHSVVHINEFYSLLEKEGLPLPSLTVITHWHWDHAFAMHCVNGLCIANDKTNKHLEEWKEKIEKNGPDVFLAINDSVRKEYEGNRDVIVKLADMVYSGEMVFNLGGVEVKILQSEAPHTDDSTLVYIKEDNVLFLGDSTCSEYPMGGKDKSLCEKLSDTIVSINPAICVEGHWTPVETDDTLSDLMGEE